VFGSLLAAISALIAVLAANWWYVAVSQYPVYAGAVCGLIYGAVLLPVPAGETYAQGNSWKHWAGIAAIILACDAFVLHPLLPK